MQVPWQRTSFAGWHCQNRRRLLRHATPAEQEFARYLSLLGIAFREQQGFYTPQYRIANFYLPEKNLIVEIDGPYHDAAKDLRKDVRFLYERGIRTLRLTNEQVLSGMIPDIRYI